MSYLLKKQKKQLHQVNFNRTMQLRRNFKITILWKKELVPEMNIKYFVKDKLPFKTVLIHFLDQVKLEYCFSTISYIADTSVIKLKISKKFLYKYAMATFLFLHFSQC